MGSWSGQRSQSRSPAALGVTCRGRAGVSHTRGEPRHPGHTHTHTPGDPGMVAHLSSSTCPWAPTAMSFRLSPVRSAPPLSARPSARGAPNTWVPEMRWVGTVVRGGAGATGRGGGVMAEWGRARGVGTGLKLQGIDRWLLGWDGMRGGGRA